MHRWIVVALVVCLPLTVHAQPPKSSSGEMVEIDGKKNPELIPQYAVWLHVLRWLVNGPGVIDGSALPNGLREHVTPADEALILKEGKRLELYHAECGQRGLKVREPLARLEAVGASMKERLPVVREVDARLWDLDLSCRWETLHTRDRLLERLSDEGRAALVAFVESRKGGMNILVPKIGMDRFRQPE